MAHEETDRTDRRKFLQAGALATASAASVTPGLSAKSSYQSRRYFPLASWVRRVSRFDARGWRCEK